jgi:hypothetical protein
MRKEPNGRGEVACIVVSGKSFLYLGWLATSPRRLALNVRSSLCATLLFLTAACTATPPRNVDEVTPYDHGSSYPHWSGKPVTWGKLGDIEEWLDGDGPRDYPEYVDAAELELAEGRLALAKRESAGLSTPLLATRLTAAERGFRQVLASSRARTLQKDRAEDGLAEIEALRGVKVASVAPRKSQPAAASAPLGLTVLKRDAWRAASPRLERLTSVTTPYSRITIHHSAKDSDGGDQLHTTGDVAEVIKKIQTFHVRERGWGDIGYHFLIDASGNVWQGRALDWQGAHAGGDDNIGNVGICLLGDFRSSPPNGAALAALERLVEGLCERHHIARSKVFGHMKFAKTECPGNTLMAWIARYTASATH